MPHLLFASPVFDTPDAQPPAVLFFVVVAIAVVVAAIGFFPIFAGIYSGGLKKIKTLDRSEALKQAAYSLGLAVFCAMIAVCGNYAMNEVKAYNEHADAVSQWLDADYGIGIDGSEAAFLLHGNELDVFHDGKSDTIKLMRDHGHVVVVSVKTQRELATSH